MKKKITLVTILALICAMAVSTLSLAYDASEKHLADEVLDNFARKTAATTEGGLTVTTGGDVSITEASLSIPYAGTIASTGTGYLNGEVYACAPQTNLNRYLAIKYSATGAIAAEHLKFALVNRDHTIAFTAADIIQLAAAKGVEDEAIVINTDGTDNVILIDVASTYTAYKGAAVSAEAFGNINELFIFVNDDPAFTGTSNFVIKAIYSTSNPTSSGFVTGDANIEDFTLSAPIHWRRPLGLWAGTNFDRAGLKMDLSDTAAFYQVVSDTKGNLTRKYSYATITAFADTDNTDGFTIAGVKADNTLTAAIGFADLTKTLGASALSTSAADYRIDLKESFGTTEVKGFKIAPVAEASGIAYFTSIMFTEYDYAPLAPSENRNVVIDTDNMLEFKFYDYSGDTNAGNSLNWVYQRNVTLNSTAKTITMKSTTTADSWYQASSKDNNESSEYRYVVFDIKGSVTAPENFKISFHDAGTDYWMNFCNAYTSSGDKASIGAETRRVVIDLEYNSQTYLGYKRSGKATSGLKFQLPAGIESEVTISGVYFANELEAVEPNPDPDPDPNSTGKRCGEKASVTFSILGLLAAALVIKRTIA